MEGIGKVKGSPITVIPRNMEQYVSFSLGKLRFLDSFQMMSSSLETLTANLARAGTENFKVLRQCFPEDKIPLLVRKGVYPYEYVDGPARLQETGLPPKDAFFSTLTGEGISDLDYEHAKNAWDSFQIGTLGDYHDLYVKSDVLLLADVFQSFRQICMKTYKLDASHFFTAPGLAWEACLKHTGVNLELLTDLDQYLFVEEGIRGGVSMISTRYSKANNKYLPDYDPELPSKYIGYYDANNLYGWAMSLPLPVDQFRWMSPDEIQNFNVQGIPESSDTGYILSVDLDYPSELHQSHSDYPLAPEKMKITPEMLSPYSLGLNDTLNISAKESVTKLVPNLNNKKNYIIHYRNLQHYLKLGLKLTCIHKVLQFRQSAWLKPYIELNTECRKNATNDFEKDFFKLMNNAVFGKSMEDVRKRISIALIKTERRLKRYAASPAFHAFKIFNEDLVGVHMLKASIKLNRPIQTGFTILDNSKILMYDFHYNYIRETYHDKAKLLMTDTDSLCYEFETEDLYRDNGKDHLLFDTSDYPKDHFLFSNENKKVLGKMKDELAGVPLEEFIGLRPKMYSMTSAKGEKKIAKGIVKATVRKHIRHLHYKECLFNQTNLSVQMTRISSNAHKLTTVKIHKLGLSATDDKRHILSDGIHTFAHGHCEIAQPMEL